MRVQPGDKPEMSERDRARRRVSLAGVAGWVTILVGVTVVVLLAADGLWLVAGLTTVWWPLPVWGVINAIAPWRVRERARRGQVGGIFG